MGVLGEGGCTSSQEAGRDRRLIQPPLSHFSEEEKGAQRKVLPKDCGEAAASPSPWQESPLDFWAVLENCFNQSGLQLHWLLVTVRAAGGAVLLKHLGIICVMWPPCCME